MKRIPDSLLLMFAIPFFLHTTTFSQARRVPGMPLESSISRFGYRFSLYNLNRFDSNIYRLSNSRSDLAGGLFPSLSAEYLFSPQTRLTGSYRFGIERFISSSILNTTSHRGALELSQKLSSRWNVAVYDVLERSNQPDVLSTKAVYSFATYTQNKTGVRVDWVFDTGTLFSLEYFSHQRSYSRFDSLLAGSQNDVFHSLGLRWSHRFGGQTFASVQTGFQINTSNNASYRYTSPFLSGYVTRNLSPKVELELLARLNALSFSERRASANLTQTRGDFSATTMLGIRTHLTDFCDLSGRYYFQKNFSNEPQRIFSDHSLSLGIEVFFGKPVSSPPETFEVGLNADDRTQMTERLHQAQTLANLGYEHLLKGEYQTSLDYSLRATAIDAQLEAAHTNAGIAYYKLGSRAQAIREWELALKLSPGNVKVRSLLGKARDEQ